MYNFKRFGSIPESNLKKTMSIFPILSDYNLLIIMEIISIYHSKIQFPLINVKKEEI